MTEPASIGGAATSSDTSSAPEQNADAEEANSQSAIVDVVTGTAVSAVYTQQLYQYRLRLHEAYKEERRALVTAEGALDQATGAAILTVSAGALGLSLAFVKDFQLSPTNLSSWTLAFAWVSLVTALLLSLLTSKLNQETHARYREILDEEFRGEIDSALERAQVRQLKVKWRPWLRAFDWTRLFLCVAGTAALFVFVFQTLKHRGGESEQRQSESNVSQSPNKDPRPVSDTSTKPAPPAAPDPKRTAPPAAHTERATRGAK